MTNSEVDNGNLKLGGNEDGNDGYNVDEGINEDVEVSKDEDEDANNDNEVDEIVESFFPVTEVAFCKLQRDEGGGE